MLEKIKEFVSNARGNFYTLRVSRIHPQNKQYLYFLFIGKKKKISGKIARFGGEKLKNSLQILYIIVLRAENVAIFESKKITISGHNTNIYKVFSKYKLKSNFRCKETLTVCSIGKN